MPVFVERASADRDSRVNPVLESALPRITPPPPIDSDKYEVIIAGSYVTSTPKSVEAMGKY